MLQRAVVPRGACNRSPAIKLTIGPVVSRLQRFRPELRRPINHMPGVVEIPITGEHASLANHVRMQFRPGVRSLDMKRSRGDAVFYSPVNRSLEHVFAIIIHAENET